MRRLAFHLGPKQRAARLLAGRKHLLPALELHLPVKQRMRRWITPKNVGQTATMLGTVQSLH